MRERPKSDKELRIVAVSRWRQQQGGTSRTDSTEGLAILEFALHPVDRRTWEDFWSNLLGEYEHLGSDVADAA